MSGWSPLVHKSDKNAHWRVFASSLIPPQQRIHFNLSIFTSRPHLLRMSSLNSWLSCPVHVVCNYYSFTLNAVTSTLHLSVPWLHWVWMIWPMVLYVKVTNLIASSSLTLPSMVDENVLDSSLLIATQFLRFNKFMEKRNTVSLIV